MPIDTIVQAIEILLVDDNPGDIRLTQEALKDSKLQNNLNVVQDGIEAMAYLRKIEPYTTVTTPDLVLLDLNLPKKDGREVLQEIKEDPELRRIPVAVLTMSEAHEDILKSYNLYANCYITKPLDIAQFFKVVRSIEDFWFTIVTKAPKT